MGLCILEGRKSKEIKSGEALLLTIGSTGAQFYWSYNGTFYTDGFMQFKNLDFSDVRSFTFQMIAGTVGDTGSLQVFDSSGAQLISAASGTCEINGRTGVTVKAWAQNKNFGGNPTRTLIIPSYVDINGLTHTL